MQNKMALKSTLYPSIQVVLAGLTAEYTACKVI